MDNIEIKTLSEEAEICKIINYCSDSILDQTLNNKDTIKKLSQKFAKFAVFRAAYINSVPCGLSAFYANDQEKHNAFLSLIVVDHSYQKQGIGKLLLTDTINICKAEGMQCLFLEVDNNNSNAIRFYKKFGFIWYCEKSNSSSVYKYEICL